jgi:MFS family permease
MSVALLTTSPRRTWSLRTSFWVVVAAQVLLLAGSNFPTPLFPVYERTYGFSSGMVTLLFAVYVLAVIPSMLTLGRLADRIGRRPTLVAGIAISAASSLAFAFAGGIAWLFAGEIIYGVAAGLVMSCAPVAIRELHPKGSAAGGSLAATLAFPVGLTLGPLVSGVLATVTPWPTVAPYALDVALAGALVLALLRIPETRPDVPRPARRPPVLHVPAEIRGTFLATTLAGATPWMATGWVFGLSPSFLHEELGVHITQPVVAGLFAALMVASNGAAQLGFRRHHHLVGALRAALVVMVVGIGAIAASTLVGALPLALAGAVLAGGGAGVVQLSTMASVQAMAPDHARGGVNSAFLTAGYVGLSVPVVLAGVTADRLGLGHVTGWYLVGLAVLVGGALLASRRPTERAVVDDRCELAAA